VNDVVIAEKGLVFALVLLAIAAVIAGLLAAGSISPDSPYPVSVAARTAE